MTDRKEPPFFNDSVETFHHKLPFYDTMDLFIETLTGTCFELRVLPYEAVISVKAKIQQLEGIPVSQQHLIWNNLELDNEHCLHDYGIAEGCTLKLVLAMRGGPINTRRVTIEDPVKEVADQMEGTREQGFEKSVSNKQVTFVVYRESDQLNFFRVVDRGDGTLTPLAESLSGGSVYNVYPEEEDGESSVAAQQKLENSITMSKMKMLKAKMDDMNLNKKPKKSAKLKPRPPVSPIPCGSTVGPSSTRHHHRLFCMLPQTNQLQQSNTQLPPVRDHNSVHSTNLCAPTPCAHLSVSRRPPSFSSPSCYMLEEKEEEEPWEASPPFANIHPPPKVSRLDIGSARFMRDFVYPQLPPTYTRGPPEATCEAAKHAAGAVGLGLLEKGTGLLEPSKSGATFGELSHTLSLDVSTQAEGGHRTFDVGAQHQLPLAPSPLSSWPRGTNDAIASRTNRTQFGSSFHVSPPSPLPTSPSPATKLLPQPFDSTVSFLQPILQAQIKPSTTSPHPSTTSSHPPRPHGVKVESPGKMPEFISKKEARDIANMASQTYKEPLGSVDRAELLASLSKRPSDNCMNDCLHEGLGLTLALPLAAPSGEGNLGSRLPSIPAHSLIPNDGVRQMSPLHRATASYMATNSLTSAGGLSHLFGRTGAPTYQLPPVKPPTGSKKSSKHCFLCGRKTGLATSYECRCGHSFCATHRYAETHNCSYDYKSAGRRLLQQTNPLISAPKLPKI
ncbi:AN1-type zinc finger protein 4 isoform X2 [Thalassophryne amazonica]|uniref:AN1-type zinc finger protein 4 isoform X2 n=1 Tax=Thalassophryne amazonica TaxID=390379 RepID=UPI001470DA09|nr:AN1-type zinc finger protein 4 isoform X2 [Thalassophryne amazonica]